MKSPLRRYLERHALTSPWRIEGVLPEEFAGAVVIPALAEESNLFDTLKSLEQASSKARETTLVLVVINHREDASAAFKEENRRTLRRLKEVSETSPLRLGWVDAVSPGLELPSRDGGVGLARRIGMDLALPHLNVESGYLACLDADTLVSSGYLDALGEHFRNRPAGGAVLPFAHRCSEDPAVDRAILRYELFLRHYVLGLSLAGSPYAFHSIGSALACGAEAYCRVGGMVKRQAGEDFYFLQKLAKDSGIAQVTGACVHPSPRISKRTPFGTGVSVARLAAGEKDAVLFYPPEHFERLGRFLALRRPDTPEALMTAVEQSCPELRPFFEQIGLPDAWEKILRNHPAPGSRERAFHNWFDGLRTLKCIHFLCEQVRPKCQPEASVPDLLRRAGLPAGPESRHWLATLRRTQAEMRIS